MIRATTGGVLNSYRANLMHSFISQNKAMDTVLTRRNFNSYAEDPAIAARAFRLRKSMLTVESQHTICNDTYKKYQTAWSCLDTISKQVDTETAEPMKTLSGTSLKWLNDPSGDARTQLGKVLDQISQSIVQTMNQTYGGNFIFAGADGHNVPFDYSGTKLLYRGVPVDAAVPEVYDDNGAAVMLDANGNVDPSGDRFLVSTRVKTISKEEYDRQVLDYQNDPTSAPPVELLCDAPANPGDPGTPHLFTDADGNQYYIKKAGATGMTQEEIDTATEDAEKLAFLVGEKQFVDIGLGFQENVNGQLIESSAFNAALNGLTFLGYGLDEDGDPKNIYSLVQQMKEITESVPEGGDWNGVWPDFKRLVGKLESAASNFKTEYTNMDAMTTKLENNVELLEDNYANTWEETSDLEDVDMVEAITSFLWAQYAYNAALKVGNSVLSQSLMDYLN